MKLPTQQEDVRRCEAVLTRRRDLRSGHCIHQPLFGRKDTEEQAQKLEIKAKNGILFGNGKIFQFLRSGKKIVYNQ